MIYLLNAILFSNIRNELLIYVTIRMNLRNIMLRKRSQLQKDMLCDPIDVSIPTNKSLLWILSEFYHFLVALFSVLGILTSPNEQCKRI